MELLGSIGAIGCESGPVYYNRKFYPRLQAIY